MDDVHVNTEYLMLPVLGRGTMRQAVSLGDDVLKVPLPDMERWGQMANVIEYRVWETMSTADRSLLTTVHAYAQDGAWLLAERVTPLTPVEVEANRPLLKVMAERLLHYGVNDPFGCMGWRKDSTIACFDWCLVPELRESSLELVDDLPDHLDLPVEEIGLLPEH